MGDLFSYYTHVYAARSSIETLAEKEWADLPTPPEFAAILQEARQIPALHFFGGNVPIYRFFAYLRHHGFPSPLLDWTASPYIAAFFAFDSMPQGAKYVSVYGMLRDTLTVLHSEEYAHVEILGPYVRTHRRHLIQQSQYSICLYWRPQCQCEFARHDYTIEPSGVLGNGELIKWDIPAGERAAALRTLDQMNINPFSLLGSEDSLVRTVGRRVLLLRNW